MSNKISNITIGGKNYDLKDKQVDVIKNEFIRPVDSATQNTQISFQSIGTEYEFLTTDDVDEINEGLDAKLNEFTLPKNSATVNTKLAYETSGTEYEVLTADEVNALTGKLSDLQTATKTSLVDAINEAARSGSDVVVDTAMSTTSTNPVQNKIVDAAIKSLDAKTTTAITNLDTKTDTAIKAVDSAVKTVQLRSESNTNSIGSLNTTVGNHTTEISNIKNHIVETVDDATDDTKIAYETSGMEYEVPTMSEFAPFRYKVDYIDINSVQNIAAGSTANYASGIELQGNQTVAITGFAMRNCPNLYLENSMPTVSVMDVPGEGRLASFQITVKNANTSGTAIVRARVYYMILNYAR